MCHLFEHWAQVQVGACLLRQESEGNVKAGDMGLDGASAINLQQLLLPVLIIEECLYGGVDDGVHQDPGQLQQHAGQSLLRPQTSHGRQGPILLINNLLGVDTETCDAF